MPIVFHNLSGYDVHLFIKKLRKKINRDDIGIIAENKNKYISFSIETNVKLAAVSNKNRKKIRRNIKLMFMGICRSMSFSLDKLASN